MCSTWSGVLKRCGWILGNSLARDIKFTWWTFHSFPICPFHRRLCTHAYKYSWEAHRQISNQCAYEGRLKFLPQYLDHRLHVDQGHILLLSEYALIVMLSESWMWPLTLFQKQWPCFSSKISYECDMFSVCQISPELQHWLTEPYFRKPSFWFGLSISWRSIYIYFYILFFKAVESLKPLVQTHMHAW